MKQMVIFVLAIGIVSVVNGQFMNCDWVLNRDCASYAGQPQECGTDGITYENICPFAKAHCNDNDLHILHHGACVGAEVSTTVSPGGTTVSSVLGQEAVLDFFCTQLSHRECDTDMDMICATDGFTYFNYCEYDKHRCTHRDVHVDHFGPCLSKRDGH